MISKGYHYVINLGIVGNFCISIDISIDSVYPGSLPKTYCSRWTRGNLGSPFSIDPQAHYSRWVFTGRNWNSTYKAGVLFSPSLSIFFIVQFTSPIIILFSFKGHKPPFWISVNLSDTFITEKTFLLKQKKYSFCVAISRKEKDGGPINYFLYGVFDHGWYGFQLKYWWLFLVSAKFRCQILLKGISDGTNMVIYHVLTIEKSEKKFFNSVSRFACNWNGLRPFKMVIRNKLLWKEQVPLAWNIRFTDN